MLTFLESSSFIPGRIIGCMYKRLPTIEKIRIIKIVLSGAAIASVCREEQISRTILYKWLNEYKRTGSRGKRKILTTKVVSGRSHWHTLNKKVERQVLKLAIKNSSYSLKKIAEVVKVSPHGVWNILKKHNLNTKKARECYLSGPGNKLVIPLPVTAKCS